jgi:hypothetical protein
VSSEVEDCLCTLVDQWRARARRFMEDAEQTRWPADMVRLTAMASTLEWAAGDLLWIVGSPRLAERSKTAAAEPHERSGG